MKADAYGHGAGPVAARLAREGADRFAVANVEEGVALRRAGIGGEILVLSRAEPEELPRISAYGLTPALYDAGAGRGLRRGRRDPERAARRAPRARHRHGPRRHPSRGARPGDRNPPTVAPRLALAGTFANLSSADDPASPETARQVGRPRRGRRAPARSRPRAGPRARRQLRRDPRRAAGLARRRAARASLSTAFRRPTRSRATPSARR